MDADDIKINDLIETPDYVGRVIADDGDTLRIHVLQIKAEGTLTKNDLLRGKSLNRIEDQIMRGSDYLLKDTKLLNVNWKDWLRLNGLLND